MNVSVSKKQRRVYQDSGFLLGLADAVEAPLELEVALLLVGAAYVVAQVVLVAAVGELEKCRCSMKDPPSSYHWSHKKGQN